MEKLGEKYMEFASIANQKKLGRSAAQVKYVENEQRQYASNGVELLACFPHSLYSTTFTFIGGSNLDKNTEHGIAHVLTYPGTDLKSLRALSIVLQSTRGQ